MRPAGFRLACLWLSQTARIVADFCLLMFMIQVALFGGLPVRTNWYQITACYFVMYVLASPMAGMLSEGVPRRTGRKVGALSAWS